MTPREPEPHEKVLREHEDLRRVLAELRGLADRIVREPGGRDAPRALLDGVEALRSRLAAHFLHEEESGLPNALADRLPHVADRADMLRGEHFFILEDLQSLVNEAHRSLLVGEELGVRARQVLLRIARHEERETSLIQQAFTSDIGGVD
jgi:hypothetical protein